MLFTVSTLQYRAVQHSADLVNQNIHDGEFKYVEVCNWTKNSQQPNTWLNLGVKYFVATIDFSSFLKLSALKGPFIVNHCI